MDKRQHVCIKGNLIAYFNVVFLTKLKDCDIEDGDDKLSCTLPT
jgi:hypothetical protein